MVDTLNSSTVKEYQTVSGVNDQLATAPIFSSNIQAVAETNPALTRRADVFKQLHSGALSIPTGKKFIITYIQISCAHTAADTGTVVSVTATNKSGLAQTLMSLKFTNAEVVNQAVTTNCLIEVYGSQIYSTATNISNYSVHIAGYYENL